MSKNEKATTPSSPPSRTVKDLILDRIARLEAKGLGDGPAAKALHNVLKNSGTSDQTFVGMLNQRKK